MSTGLAAYFYLPPVGSFVVEDPREIGALVFFVVIGAAMTFIIEALSSAVGRLTRAEHARALLLREFRHRTRNDLNSLVALLHLRARSAPSEAAREGLREAADHANALSRVHNHLAAEGKDDHPEAVQTREFIFGLCHDLEVAHSCGVLRPVAVHVAAEAHLLPTDRAVPLGLVLNEAVTNALKYAFPEDQAGTVRVDFRRVGEDYVLTVADDGIGLPPEGETVDTSSVLSAGGSGLGTRLLRGLAAQLRGSFSRAPGPEGRGAVVTLRCPVKGFGS